MAIHPLRDFIIPYAAGQSVYEEGDPGAEMFIVYSGTVEIFRELGGRHQVLAVMEKGDFFGEMSVLEGSPRNASAVVKEKSELIEINSTIFDRMIRGNIEIAVRMLRKLSGRLQQSNQKLEELLGPAGQAPLDPEPAPTPEPVAAPPLQKSAPEVTAPEKAETSLPGSGSVPGVIAPEEVVLAPGWRGALVLDDSKEVFPIQTEQALIGRFDPVTGARPEIDLTPHDTNRSVSRRHAKIVAVGTDLLISEEVGALNGTFLNDRQLTPGKPAPLRTGDQLRVGTLILRFLRKENDA